MNVISIPTICPICKNTMIVEHSNEGLIHTVEGHCSCGYSTYNSCDYYISPEVVTRVDKEE